MFQVEVLQGRAMCVELRGVVLATHEYSQRQGDLAQELISVQNAQL